MLRLVAALFPQRKTKGPWKPFRHPLYVLHFYPWVEVDEWESEEGEEGKHANGENRGARNDEMSGYDENHV